MLDRTHSQLFGDLDVEIEFDAPIGAMTWFGIGGQADALVRPHTVAALATLMQRCHQSHTPVRIFGKGANLLVDDHGVDGVVILLDGDAFRQVRFNIEGEVTRMHAMAGADLAGTLMEVVRRGLDGFCQMAGIPGTIGGALRMNAGGAYGTISDTVETVTCLTRDGEQVSYAREALRFDYRGTNIPDPVILAATFQLVPVNPIEVRKQVKEVFRFKKSTQPLADKSAGCSFRNPVDPRTGDRVPAGRLIDTAGLKGTTIGGATVSTQHANFIVTDASATATHVRELMDLVRDRVASESGIVLEDEIVIWERERGPGA